MGVSEGLHTSGWSSSVGHSVCAWCQLLGGRGYVSPQTGCAWGVRGCSPANQAGPAGSRWVWAGVSGGQGSVVVPRGTRKCGVPMGRVCECRVFAVSAELDQPASWEAMGWVRGRASGQGSRVAEGPCWCSGDRVCSCRSDRLSVVLACGGGPVRGGCWQQCLGCGRLCVCLCPVCLWNTS